MATARKPFKIEPFKHSTRMNEEYAEATWELLKVREPRAGSGALMMGF